MIKQDFNKNWSFSPSPGFTFSGGGEGGVVNLPHDYSISQKRDPNARGGALNGYFPGGAANYYKNLFAPEDWNGKRIFLEFEGAYMNTTVRVNSNIVTVHPYGYTSFVCDITPYLHLGRDNLISVNVNNNAQPNTRWYSGSGIYRPVWLMVAPAIHIPAYGVFVSSPSLSKIEVATTICNTTREDVWVKVRNTVLDGENVVAQFCSDAYGHPTFVVEESSERECLLAFDVPNAKPWSVETPYLYTLKTEVLIDGEVAHETTTPFGLRTIEVSVNEGLKINGEPIKMKGGCVHHDCGLLGAASFARAEERKVELLKQSGYNAVRCAHNPPSPAFLDACDRLGMLVIDEAFDVWREEKMTLDYHIYFKDYWQQDMTSMIKRDRNHPSIIFWSTGNEIIERSGRSDGYALARELADFVRALDSTRPVTNAICAIWDALPLPPGEFSGNVDSFSDFWAELTEEFAAPLDVVGYNYLLGRYEKDGEKYPNRIIMGAETYAKECFDYWQATEKLPYVIGDFVWTAWDYLGESGLGRMRYVGDENFTGAYPWHHAFCGDIDICGFKRPQSYYRDFVWGIGKAPYIAVYKPENHGKKEFETEWAWHWNDVVNSWIWPGFEGKPIAIEIYSDGDEVELLLNEKSLGKKPAGKANRYIAHFETTYEPGQLTAVSYKNGTEIARSVLVSAGAPASIRLTPDRTQISVGEDLSFVTIELLDKDGNVAHQANNKLYITASGTGVVQAVGSGDPLSEELYVGVERSVYYGRAMAVVKSTDEAGQLTLTVSAEGLPAAQVLICTISLSER